MAEQPKWPWSKHFEYAESHGLLGMRLYMISSKPTNGLRPILENLEEHIDWQKDLERREIMFAAGPVPNDDRTEWLGEGVFVYRADSFEAANEIAASDPMHRSGARTFSVREWILNEGTFSVQVYLSSGIPAKVR